MIPYFLLIAIPLVMCFFVIKKTDGKRVLMIGTGGECEKYNLALPSFFIILLVMVACRAETVGNDTSNYHYLFNKSAYTSISEVFSQWEECLFAFLNLVLYHISDDYQIYLAVVACIQVIPIMYFYCKDRRHSVLKIALFVNMSTFVMLFSGIRQSMAISVGVLAYDSLRKGKDLRFWILAAVSFLIHTSGFMVAFLYPLYRMRLKTKQMIFVIPVIMALFVFNNAVFSFLNGILLTFSEEFELQASSTGAVTSLFLFVVFAFLSFVFPDETQMDDDKIAFRNILLAAVVMQCFAPVHALAMRMNYYFIILIPMAVSNIFEVPKKQYAQLVKPVETAVILFFILYFVFTIYSGYASGHSALNTVPYVPFWRE